MVDDTEISGGVTVPDEDYEGELEVVSKSIFTSKIFWGAVFSPPVGWLTTHVFVNMPQKYSDDFVEYLTLLSIVFIGLRIGTKKPVHILAPKKEEVKQ